MREFALVPKLPLATLLSPKLGFGYRDSAEVVPAKLRFVEMAFPSATWERAQKVLGNPFRRRAGVAAAAELPHGSAGIVPSDACRKIPGGENSPLTVLGSPSIVAPHFYLSHFP